MKIGIITMWYNEGLLAEFFLRHYSFVDEIHVIIDKDTNDRTREICDRFFNVKTTSFVFEDGFNDQIKQEKINEVVLTKRGFFDWIYVLDADEFIFPPVGSAKQYLELQDGDVLSARMWQVYRHCLDKDLKVNDIEPIYQRRHGDPSLTGFNSFWIKPVIVRPDISPQWTKGCHKLKSPKQINFSFNYFQGTHWANADPALAVARRLASKSRQSQANINNHWQEHNHNISKEEILAFCKEHENDPQLF